MLGKAVAVLVFFLGLGWASEMLAAAQSNPLYTVSGVSVDVSDKDASRAKLKAISEAQVKAFGVLVDRLAGEGAGARLQGLSPAEIGRMMASLSIEEERMGPGRYIARLTVRFLPERVRTALAQAGISYSEERAPPIVVLPVWRDAQGTVAWSDNPWRSAWLALHAEEATVPVIVPLGDLADSQTITPEEAVEGRQDKLLALRSRYSAEAVLIAVAEPAGDSAVRATLLGDTPFGRIAFEETIAAAEGGVAAAAMKAAAEFHAGLMAQWRNLQAPSRPAAVQALPVAVPFSRFEEWNMIRSQLLSTPGVAGVDVSTLAKNGAIVRVNYAVPLEELQAALAEKRLNLALVGRTWVLRPF
jgi:hypothetical protein